MGQCDSHFGSGCHIHAQGLNFMLTTPKNSVTAVLLGVMQDAGLPHAGCVCVRCQRAWDDPTQADYAACLAIVDTRFAQTAVWLIDATPDIKFQLNLLADALGPHPSRPQRLKQPEGLFLTHAHMGHIGGLPHLGPEVSAVEQLPVYASPELCRLLARTELWRPMVQRLNLISLQKDHLLALAPDLQITAVPVPHRDEWQVGTYAYRIAGPKQTLLYLPDIDAWAQWPEAEEQVTAVDIALVDATFYSPDELGGRAPVAHPLVTDTIARFAHLPTKILLTHFNHTNPILEKGGVAETAVLQSGLQIGFTGQMFGL